MKLLGIVVLYYPDEKLIDNILSYLPFLDKLIIWENTPANSQKTIFFEDVSLQSKILRWSENSNVGLGAAFNKAVEYGEREGFTHLLTMDQDSSFVEGDFEKFITFIESRLHDNSNCFYAPNYLIKAGYYLYDQNPDLEFENVDRYLNSGTIFPISLFNKIGLFRADFFLDTIDVEYGLRAKKNNINIVLVRFVTLLHGAGYQRKKHKFLWKVFYPNEYSPIRSYYIIRNALITYKEYPNPKQKRDYLWYWFYKRLVFIILYESDKMNKMKALLLGYYHGKKGILGKQEMLFQKKAK